MRTDEIGTAITPCMDMYTRGTSKMEYASQNLRLLHFWYIGSFFPHRLNDKRPPEARLMLRHTPSLGQGKEEKIDCDNNIRKVKWKLTRRWQCCPSDRMYSVQLQKDVYSPPFLASNCWNLTADPFLVRLLSEGLFYTL